MSWFLLVSIVPASIVGYLGYVNASKSIDNDHIELVDTATEIAGESMILFIKAQKDLIKSLSINDTYRNYQNKENLSLIQDNLEEMVEDIKNFYELFLLDRNGIVIASSDPANIGLNKSKDDYFLGVKNSIDIHVKDIYRSSTTGEVGFAVSAPIFKSHNSNVVDGVLVARYDLLELDGILEHAAESIGETGDIFIVDDQKNIVTESRFLGDSVVLNTVYDSKYVTDCINGKENTGFTKDYRGRDVLGSYKNSEIFQELGKRWCMVSELDVEEIDAPIVSLRNALFLIIFFVFVGILLLSFYASKSIGEFVRKPIRSAVQQMISAATSLSSSSQQASAASQQNSSIAQQVASGSMQQSKQSEEISKSVSEMAGALQQMSASSQEASAVSTKIADIAKDAGKKGEQSQVSMEQIKAMVSGTTSMIKGMASKSEDIDTIVDTITNIAEQTNLLALNAAIEAARAGDAGRGFAVVADEVRKLAEDSGEAADRIKEQIKGMVAQIDDTVTASEEGKQTVENNAKTIGETLSSLENITAGIQQVSAKIQELSASVQQQSTSVQQVARTMDSVAAVAEQNSSGAQQLSSSTQQLSAANQQVAAAAQQLQSLSADLQKLAGSTERMKLSMGKKKIPAYIMDKSEAMPKLSTPASTEDRFAKEDVKKEEKESTKKANIGKKITKKNKDR